MFSRSSQRRVSARECLFYACSQALQEPVLQRVSTHPFGSTFTDDFLAGTRTQVLLTLCGQSATVLARWSPVATLFRSLHLTY